MVKERQLWQGYDLARPQRSLSLRRTLPKAQPLTNPLAHWELLPPGACRSPRHRAGQAALREEPAGLSAPLRVNPAGGRPSPAHCWHPACSGPDGSHGGHRCPRPPAHTGHLFLREPRGKERSREAAPCQLERRYMGLVPHLGRAVSHPGSPGNLAVARKPLGNAATGHRGTLESGESCAQLGGLARRDLG